MPFQSEEQRKFMWMKHPEVARRWTEKYGSAVEGRKSRLAAIKRALERGRGDGKYESDKRDKAEDYEWED